jgi:hypothetical protein
MMGAADAAGYPDTTRAMDATDNPLASGSGDVNSADDGWELAMESALGELGAAEQTVARLLRSREEQLEGKVAALEAKLKKEGAPAEALVHAVIGRIAGAPANCASRRLRVSSVFL